MSYQQVNVGFAPDDDSGDSIRSAGQKINSNFTEIYNFIGDGTNLSFLNLENVSVFAGSTGITTNTGNLILDPATQAVEIKGDNSSTRGKLILNCEVNSHGQTIVAQPHSAAVTNVLTLPAGGNQEIVGTVATQTLENKTILDAILTGDSVTVPSGTTADRPVTPTAGMLRVNTDTSSLEFYSNSIWRTSSIYNSLNVQNISGGTQTINFSTADVWYSIVTTENVTINFSTNDTASETILVFENQSSSDIYTHPEYIYDTNTTYDGNFTYDTTAVIFKPDGTKFFILNYSYRTLRQYSLSSAWDITTASLDHDTNILSATSLNVGSSYSMTFKPDGTKVYIVSYTDEALYEFDLSTAWDTSTISYNSVSLDLKTLFGTTTEWFRGVTFKSDGTKLYISDSWTDYIFEADLSVAWDLTTASYSNNFFDTNSDLTNIKFSADGTILYGMIQYNPTIKVLNLGTAWDITSSTVGTNITVNGDHGFDIKPDGTRLYNMDDSSPDYLMTEFAFSGFSIILPNNVDHDFSAISAPNYQNKSIYKFFTIDGGTTYQLLFKEENIL